MSIAAFLVIHGSRDPRPGLDLAQLIQQVQRNCPNVLVAGGVLETSDSPLAVQIQQFSDQAQAKGFQAVQVLPLFLLPGVHVCEDIPAEVKTAQAKTNLPLQLLPYLGQHPGLVQWLQSRFQPGQALIFLAHGSRRLEAIQWIDHLAETLQAHPAYWTKPDSLEQAIAAYAQAGIKQIRIFPYLLFAGKLLDLITQQVQNLNQHYPELTLDLTDCLRPSPGLVRLIQEMLDLSTPSQVSFTPARL